MWVFRSGRRTRSGKKFEEWWTRVRGWIAENAAALPADKAIPAVLSRMVGGTAGDFARGHLNALLRGTGPRTWPAFAELIEKHFQSTNEVDQNRAWIRDLKQKNHPMEVFLLKSKNYALLANYEDVRLIELLEANADRAIVSRLILEKGRYTDLDLLRQISDKREAASSFSNSSKKERRNGPGQKTLMPWTLMP